MISIYELWSRYLFNSNTAPVGDALLDSKYIRDTKELGDVVTLKASEFNTSYGQFIKGSDFGVIKKFFETGNSDKNFSRWKNCFGKSKNKMISGFYFNISPNEDSVILGRSYELIYGGIKINWFTNQKNIDHVKDIDAAIWRLLDAWNVSPIKNSNTINED